jgi:hypothetical protein
MLGAIDKRHVDAFKVLRRRIVNDVRGICEALRKRGKQKNYGQGSAKQAQRDNSRRRPHRAQRVGLNLSPKATA